jgi:TorA maturation chaperone TorD
MPNTEAIQTTPKGRTMTGDITTAAVQDTMSASLRIDIYTMLAALLSQPPASDRLAQLEDLNILPGIPSALGRAIAELKMACRRTSAEAAVKEYNILFVGLGRGDIVPYASWYEEGMLMALPLARLRQDLARMAIHRRGETCEPEDHVAALCEAMVLLIAESRIAPAQEAAFFNAHIAPWMPSFFEDL